MHESHGKFVTAARRGDDGVWRFELDAYSSYPAESEGGQED